MSKLACRASAGSMMLIASIWSAPALALSMQECSAKYKAAQGAGTLGGMDWKDFRKAQCGPGASPLAAAAPPNKAGRAGSSYSPSSLKPGPVFGGGGNAVFPAAVSPRYAGASLGKARMHTCLDQYKANKASGSNGGLKWIQKGGGYYSLCNRRLGGN